MILITPCVGMNSYTYIRMISGLVAGEGLFSRDCFFLPEWTQGTAPFGRDRIGPVISEYSRHADGVACSSF